MSVRILEKEKRIGLALSGGGFRAAAFHLGVMRKLAEMHLLDKIDVFSCVSGGSIAGGCVVSRWGSPDALVILENYLKTRSIAVASVLGGVIDPFGSRLDKLADSYDQDLFPEKGLTLKALYAGPRIYFNATNLATGNLFFFAAGGKKETIMGEHELGVVDADNFPVCRAIAASSAFPPVFPPLLLNAMDYKHAADTDYVTLCDGGVYDNMGIAPLLLSRNDLQYIIVSDGGKPFTNKEKPTESGAVVLLASLDIMMEQIRGLEFDRLQFRHQAGAGPKPLWFSIDSLEGEAMSGDAAFASLIKTDLRKLTDAEMAVLTRQGGSLVYARIAKYAPELLG